MRALWSCGLLLALLGGVEGCARQQLRLQAEDEGEREKYAVETVRNIAQFDLTEPAPVAGVGLVTGLSGTGGDPPSGDYRRMLEKDFPKLHKDVNIKELLASKDTSLVLVSGQFPPGAKKDDPIDLEVTLPAGSKTTSLRGGYLQKCWLYNYDIAQRLAPTAAANNANAVLGHPLVVGEGSLLVGLGDGDDGVRVKQARVWGGGRCRRDRPFVLVLNENKKFATIAKNTADRINETFQTPFTQSFGQGTAVAQNNEFLILNVPPQYRLNLQRYLRIVGLIPLREPSDSYRRRLEEELADPARCVTAALRLEAIGDSSRAVLKKSLTHENPLVRFCCAESLAYLNDSACGKELGLAVQTQPLLRSFALTALASLDEAISQETLVDLLSEPNPETRYGAFRALRALNDREPAVQGELLQETFWLHKVAPGTPGLVHISGRKRAEIVFFGEEPYLATPLGIRAGEFNITAAQSDSRCTIGHFPPGGRARRAQCSLKLEEVVRTLAEMGAGYGEVVEVVRQAKGGDSLTCSVEMDALPQATSVHALQKAGERARVGVKGQQLDHDADEEILNARLDLGSTPTLFEKGANGKVGLTGDRASKARSEKKTAERSAKEEDE